MDQEVDDHEIIVVDNGSTDGTRALAELEAAERRMVRYVYEPIPGLLSGRHRGALEARGEICAFLDDDVWVGRDWLMGLRDAFRNINVALVGGPSTPKFETAPPDWLAEFYSEDERGRYCGWLSLVDCGDRVRDIDPCLVWGLNYAIRRQVLFNLGGFHPDCIPKMLQRYQGDGETGLSLKVSEAGLTAQYHPRVSVQHLIPKMRLTVGYFEERAFYQGVCNSYTKIRSVGGMAADTKSGGSAVGRIMQFVQGVVRPNRTEAQAIRRRTATSRRAGYSFHQDEVRRDPRLLEWVLRRDYMDYQLPVGWERFMSAAGAAG